MNLHAETHLTFFFNLLTLNPVQREPEEKQQSHGKLFWRKDISAFTLFIHLFLFFTRKDNKAVDVSPGPTFKPVKLIVVTICGYMQDTLALYLQSNETSFSAPSLLHLPVSNQEHLLCFSVEGFGALTPLFEPRELIRLNMSCLKYQISLNTQPHHVDLLRFID